MATATTPTNRITRTIVPGKTLFPDATNQTNSTVDYNQGDLLCFLSSLVDTPTAEADGATFLGIAAETVVAGKLKRPYTTAVDASFGADALVGPQFSVVAKLLLKTGSTLTVGQSLYLDPVSSPAGVQPTGTKPIGIYQGAAISGSAAGLAVEVLLGCRYPNDTLKF